MPLENLAQIGGALMNDVLLDTGGTELQSLKEQLESENVASNTAKPNLPIPSPIQSLSDLPGNDTEPEAKTALASNTNVDSKLSSSKASQTEAFSGPSSRKAISNSNEPAKANPASVKQASQQTEFIPGCSRPAQGCARITRRKYSAEYEKMQFWVLNDCPQMVAYRYSIPRKNGTREEGSWTLGIGKTTSFYASRADNLDWHPDFGDVWGISGASKSWVCKEEQYRTDITRGY